MLRVVLIIVTILLYVWAWHQNQLRQIDSNGVTAIQQDKAPLANTEPYYSERFINRERTGTISHVSSISPLGQNNMACAWYAGSREGAGDVSIYFSQFDEESQNWGEPVVLVDRLQSSRELQRYVKKVGNPLLYTDTTGRLWLFYSTVTVGGWSGCSLNYKISTDGGSTWSESKKMILSPFFNLTENVKNKGISFDDGSFIIPIYHEFINKYSQLALIRPGGGSIRYEVSKITTTGKAIQPSILQDEGQAMTAFFRNMGGRKEGYILKARSNNMGQTWSGLSETSLPNPNSGFDMITLDDNRYLAVINNSFHDRSNLTILVSEDKGVTWKTVKVLENSPGKEYSYPSLIRSRSGLYHITYTYERRRIKHIVFNEAWIRSLK